MEIGDGCIAELIGVDKVYHSAGREVKALDNVSLKVKKGSVLGVYGQNGSGKTTLLRVIAGLERPTRGRVIVLGLELWSDEGWRGVRGRVAMTFQRSVVYDGDVYDNIAYGLRARGGHTSRERVEVEKIARVFRLHELLHTNAKTLSEGQKKRVMLARTIAARPELLLLDEPEAWLDVSSYEILKRVIESIKDKTTIIIASPNPKTMLSLVDEVVLLEGGSIRGVLDVDEFRDEVLLSPPPSPSPFPEWT